MRLDHRGASVPSYIDRGGCRWNTGGEVVTFPGDSGERGDILEDPINLVNFCKDFCRQADLETFWDC